MKKSKKNKTLLTVIILLLAITIGYAAIATTLKINGSADVKSARWNVYWDENSIAVTEGSVETSQGNGARVTDAGKTQVEYSVELSEPGDFYEFTVDAVNEGSLNAKIAPNGVKNNVYESDGTTPKNLPDYLGYTVKYAENDADVTAGDVLEAKKGNTPTRKKYKVRVWYKTDIDPSTLNDSTTETMKLVFEVDYIQGEKPENPVKILKGTKGNLQPGDMVGIGDTEDFYVISSDNSANGKTVLLAKYNLLVGNESHDAGSTLTPMNPSTTQGYGLQSVDAIGGYCRDTIYGGVTFTDTVYWMDSPSILKNKYNNNDAIYYDNNEHKYKNRDDDSIAYPYIYDENSNIYQYISGQDGYVNRLRTMGAPDSITGRLLSYEEADAVKNIQDDETGKSIIFDGHQDYWLGTTSDSSGIWLVYYESNSFMDWYYELYEFGVRPVIEIPTSEIG